MKKGYAYILGVNGEIKEGVYCGVLGDTWHVFEEIPFIHSESCSPYIHKDEIEWSQEVCKETRQWTRYDYIKARNKLLT